MPFDAVTDLKSNDALANLGIVPVPAEQVEAYKENLVQRFAIRSDYHLSLVERKFVVWRSMTLRSRDLVKSLTYPLIKYQNTEDISAAPKPLIDLAVHVRNRLQNAAFYLEYFDTDPVLYVAYAGEIACLGVWDAGQLVYIAKWQGTPSLFDRLSGRFPRLAALF